MPKCECGLSYVSGVPEDEEAHACMHAEYQRGPQLPWLLSLDPADEVLGFPLYRVDRSVASQLRSRLAHAALVAHRSMSEYPAGYDGTVTEDDQRLYLIADDFRAVSLAIVSRDNRFWSLSWSNGGATLRRPEAATDHRYKVARLWTAKDYRLLGLAVGLVKFVANDVAVSLGQMGWELPLTDAGAVFLRSFLPDEWWGCGDGEAVRETIER